MGVREASQVLGVSEDELVERGVKAYLENELRRIKAEMHSILVRYSIPKGGIYGKHHES